jgi:hypothetical protein
MSRFFLFFKRIFLFFGILGLAGSIASCDMNTPTFPQEKIKESIKQICLDDYGIKNVEVKMVGRTVGVHLPLKQLFQNDIQQLLLTGKVKDFESFLQLSDDAIDKIQNVIFTTSRVLFSSEDRIDFYVVKATDVENTGLEFILANYLEDVKRVRFWDISLSEYYKRSYRDLKLNQSLFLKRPVLELFRNVGKMSLLEILRRYFDSESSLKDISPFFYALLMEYAFKDDIKIEILDSRVRVFGKDEILVYAKTQETYVPKPQYKEHRFIYPSGTQLEYLFILKVSHTGHKILRVLPFNYVAPDGSVKKIEFPENLKIYQNIDTWPSDFEVEEIHLEEFLAEQLNQRTQALISQDPKITEAFEEVKVDFSYFPPYETRSLATQLSEKAPKYFSAILKLKSRQAEGLGAAPLYQDKVLQSFLQKLLEEFQEVMQGYHFTGYDLLSLEVEGGGKRPLEFPREWLEKFRKKKVFLKDFLRSVAAEPVQDPEVRIK